MGSGKGGEVGGMDNGLVEGTEGVLVGCWRGAIVAERAPGGCSTAEVVLQVRVHAMHCVRGVTADAEGVWFDGFWGFCRNVAKV